MIRVLITIVLGTYTWNKIKRWLKELGKEDGVYILFEDGKRVKTDYDW